MTTYKIITILGLVKKLFLAILIPILVFYVFLIVPDYLACNDGMYEGEKGIDIWGASVDCNAESMAFSKAFFQLFSIAIAVLSFVWIVIFLISYQLKKRL